MKCCYKRNNCYDRYAIGATKRLRGRLANSTVGHLPREISRATRFFLLRRGVVCAKEPQRSPLVQGGLEIPVQVTAEMDLTERNKAILEKHKQIVVSNYKEPGMDDNFDDCVAASYANLASRGVSTNPDVVVIRKIKKKHLFQSLR